MAVGQGLAHELKLNQSQCVSGNAERGTEPRMRNPHGDPVEQ